MKRSLTIISFLAAFHSNAQKISVNETTEKFSNGSHEAATTTILEADLDNVIKEWKKVLKDFKNAKVKDDQNEVFGDNILIKDWGNNTADFYTKFDENKKDRTIKMSTAVDLGGAYLKSSEQSDKFKYLEKMTKEFAIKMTKEPIEDRWKAADKAVSRLEDKQKDLEKDNKSLHQDISDYKGKISKDEKDLVAKEADIKKKKSELDVQKKVVDASSGAVSEQAKSSKKIHDKLEGQLKDMEGDKNNLNDDIVKYKEKIKKAEKDIKTNEEDQVKKKQEIETSKKSRDEIKKKLDSIN